MKKEVISVIIVLFVLMFLFIFLYKWDSSSLTGRATRGIINLTIEPQGIEVFIDSPENISYFFNVGSTYTLDLNVSSFDIIDTWWYTLEDLRHNRIVYENVTFTPNVSFNAVRWSNRMIVYGNDSTGDYGVAYVIFSIEVPNSAPILGYIPEEILVCENDVLNYPIRVYDVDEDILYPDISPKNPFYVFPSIIYDLLNEGKNNSYMYVVSSKLLKVDVGTYPETISISDGNYSDFGYTNITVIEINNIPSMNDIGVITLYTSGVNSTLDMQVGVVDTEDGNQDSERMVFNLTFLTGKRLFNISRNGTMYYEAIVNDTGLYNISLCVTDNGLINPHPNISMCGQLGLNNTVCKNFSITIVDENRAPYFTSYYPLNLSIDAYGNFLVSFNASYYDPDLTIPDAYWYLDGVFAKYQSGNSSSEFNHTFPCGQEGNHSVKIEITDGLLNDSIEWNISLIMTPCYVEPSGGDEGGEPAKPAPKVVCDPKWVCRDWGICQNVNISFYNGVINLGEKNKFFDLCLDSRIKWINCGYQLRSCYDINNCNSTYGKPNESRVCLFTPEPNCFDGILNCHDGKCEVLIDCGGPCVPCPTCSDGIKNQGEEGVDCGGPCPWKCPAYETFIERSKIKYIFYWILIILLIILIIMIIIKIIKIIKIRREEKELAWYKL